MGLAQVSAVETADTCAKPMRPLPITKLPVKGSKGEPLVGVQGAKPPGGVRGGAPPLPTASGSASERRDHAAGAFGAHLLAELAGFGLGAERAGTDAPQRMAGVLDLAERRMTGAEHVRHAVGEPVPLMPRRRLGARPRQAAPGVCPAGPGAGVAVASCAAATRDSGTTVAVAPRGGIAVAASGAASGAGFAASGAAAAAGGAGTAAGGLGGAAARSWLASACGLGVSGAGASRPAEVPPAAGPVSALNPGICMPPGWSGLTRTGCWSACTTGTGPPRLPVADHSTVTPASSTASPPAIHISRRVIGSRPGRARVAR